MSTNFCDQCKRNHPGRICDYDPKTGLCAETNNKMIVIGLGNKARQGKDTVGNAIVDYFGDGAKIFKFATALYDEVNTALAEAGSVENLLANLTYYTGKHIDVPSWVKRTPDAKPEPGLPYGKHGALLQWWGTNFRRAQDPNYWVKKAIASIPDGLEVAVFTDMRFPNEAWAIMDFPHGYTVNVQRFNEDGTPYRSADRPADHPSETALDDYNYDYRISAKSGEISWLSRQAVDLATYLVTKEAACKSGLI
jgi:hypothetical protein